MRKRTPLIVCVYKITSPNGGVYIGSTKSLNKRYTKHKIGSSNKLLRESVEKYGWDAHIKEIIVECEENDMKIIERAYIAEHLQNAVLFNVYGKDKTSKYHGVYWDKRNKKWLAYIYAKRKRVGYFVDEYDAHLAREKELKN